MPNAFAKKIIEEFVEKYVNQRGEIWNKIQESCIEYKSAKRIRQEKIDFLNKERATESELEIAAERVRVARDILERENYLLIIATERDLVERREAERVRVAREAERARVERYHVAREAERARVEAETARVERVRVAREAERARVEAETARLETEIGQGNFRYRERPQRPRRQR
jgi:hypothetical protein